MRAASRWIPGGGFSTSVRLDSLLQGIRERVETDGIVPGTGPVVIQG